MVKFAEKTKVCRTGSHQVMEVLSESVQSANSGSGTLVKRKAMVLCQWQNEKGKTITREFAASDLRPVKEG